MQMGGVVGALTAILNTMCNPHSVAPCVRWCMLWTAMFPKMVLSGKQCTIFHSQARRALINRRHHPTVLAAVLGVHTYHSSRVRLEYFVPIDVQTVPLLRVAVANQRNLQRITMGTVAPKHRAAWLAMPCTCKTLPKNEFKEEMKYSMPLVVRAHRRGQPNAMPCKHQIAHTNGDCALTWSRMAGLSTTERQQIVKDYARSMGAALCGPRSFGFDPSLCIILDTFGADPYDDLKNAMAPVMGAIEDFTPDALRKICLGFGAVYTTFALEWPCPPDKTFLETLSCSSAFKKAYKAAFDSLPLSAGQMNMYASVPEMSPKWTTVRHVHCSESYRELVVLLLLCLYRLRHGIDDHGNHALRGAVPLPETIGELYLELFLNFLPPSIIRHTAWENAVPMPPLPHFEAIQGPYAVLHAGHAPAPDSVPKRRRVSGL